MTVGIEKTTRLSIDIPESVQQALHALAAEKERSIHHLTKRAIDEYLTRETEEKAQRESFYDNAEAAIEHYRDTGLHLTHNEVADWLNSHKSGNTPKKPPQCHK